ncbi:MAG: DUF2325 domain-containing protein [Nitrospinae bacterium]|nr:DUF2325 domain-containing protein [Nitrospinota bacterium]
MSIAILGGLDRMKRTYEEKGRAMGFDIRFFGQRVPNLGKRLAGVDGIVIFTGTVAHHMVEEAVKVGKLGNIPIGRCHSSGVSGLKRCLEDLGFCRG